MPRLTPNSNPAPDEEDDSHLTPEEQQEKLAEEIVQANFASADALERIAFLMELALVKLGHLQMDDCEYYPERPEP
jgi:hypothetical protein